jgi:methionyl-tRNA formyltransferase
VKLWKAIPAESAIAAPAGTILEIGKTPTGLLVAAAPGTAVRLLETQPESGKRMNASDWARGLHLAPGDRFDV